jgi:hypothetical protein
MIVIKSEKGVHRLFYNGVLELETNRFAAILAKARVLYREREMLKKCLSR